MQAMTLRMLLPCRPLVSDRVSFELSQEAVEALRAKLVSTPGFGAFGQQQQQQQSQPQQPPHQPSQHGRPPPSPSLQDPSDPEFLRWKVQLGCPDACTGRDWACDDDDGLSMHAPLLLYICMRHHMTAACPLRHTVSKCVSCPQAQHPCVLEHFDSFAEQARGKRIAVFLDYDGAWRPPAVSNPEQCHCCGRSLHASMHLQSGR
jgi:hypothetical protein